MEAFIAVGADESVLAVLHTVFIANDAVALAERPPLLALAALSALVLGAVGVP